MEIPTLFKFLDTGLTHMTPENFTDECPICTVSYDDILGRRPKETIALPCRHVFHRSCIAQWLENGPGGVATCPNCRREVCKRPEMAAEQFQRSLIPSASNNWAEERSESIWAAGAVMENNKTKTSISEILGQVANDLPPQKRGRPTNSRICMMLCKRTFTIFHAAAAPSCPGLLLPGSVLEYVAVRTIFDAIRVRYEKKHVDATVPRRILTQLSKWEKTETTSVEKIYRRIGLGSLANGVKKEALKQVQRAFEEQKRLREGLELIVLALSALG